MSRTHLRRLLLVTAVAAAIPAVSTAASTSSRPTARTSRGCARVYWRSLRNGDQRCPYTHSILSDLSWRLHWRSWNGHSAYGVGVSVARNAICNSHGCHDQRDPLRVRLTRPRDCPDGTTIWTRINAAGSELINGRRVESSSQWSYACTPRLGSGGGVAGG